MTTMRVRWEIDIDAKSPVDAARQALAIQRRAESTATVFTVVDARGQTTTVDLDEEDTEGE
jgi:hypothetical protein